MIRIFRKRKFLVRIFLPIALFTYSAISFVVTRTPTISIASSNILYTNSNYSASFDVPFNNIERNFTDFWITVRARLTNDSLYPATFDDKQVITALRHGKIIYADLFKKQTSLKLMLKFEGSQTAIFKVKLLERDNKGEHQCNVGCERPEYEIVAYTLNRMFDLRNMPYTAGRNLSWSSDLEPVASPALKTFVQVEEDFSVCFNWSCLGRPSTRYCFKNGEIPGAVIYFIEDANIRFIKSSKNFYHGYHLLAAEKNSPERSPGRVIALPPSLRRTHLRKSLQQLISSKHMDNERDLQRLPGDKRFCKNFRLDLPYTMDAWFLDIIDIAVLDYLMSHLDAKHTYISEGHNFSEPEFNVMFDFGHAFCHIGDKLLILAPLIQCCRIRTRLFKAMDKYRDTLEEMFISLTKDDALHPLLTPELMSDLNHRFKQTLALTDFCRNLEGDSVFFIDL